MPDAKSSWFDSHVCTSIFLMLLFVFVVLLVIAELAARTFFPQWAPMTAERARFWQFDPVLGWRHIAGQSTEFSHPDFTVTVSINSDGLRDREYSLHRNKKKRMLVLGDSFGWGFGVADGEVFSELLEQQRSDWEIINASVSGYGTVQQYLYYREKGYQYQADVVLLLFYDNDFQDNVGEIHYGYQKPVVTWNEAGYRIDESPLTAPDFYQRIHRYILGHFYLGRMLYQGVGVLGNFLKALLPSAPSPVSDAHLRADSLGATAYVLGEFLALAQTRQAQPVIVQLPLSEEKHQLIAEVCQQYHTPCFHLNRVFPKGRKQPWYFPHDRHWNAEGHRMAAEAIGSFLSREQLW